MKKLVLIFTVFMSIQLYGQTAPNKNILGIVAGINSSNISNYAGKSLIGFTGGFYWDWKFSEKFSLQSNFLYSQRGEQAKGDVAQLKLGYLNMPILLKYSLTEKFSAMTGIFVDVLLTTNSENLSRKDLTTDDFGIPIGIGYDITKKLQLGLSYNIGLKNISNHPNWKHLKNNWGSITLAYVFK